MSFGSVFITDRAFWRPGSGVAARQREMLGYLAEQGPVDLIYLGTALGEFERLAANLAASAAAREIRCEALVPTLDLRRAAARLGGLIAERRPSRVLVMSDDLAWVPDFVPATIPVLLDAEAAETPVRLGEAELFALARRFDRVLCACEGMHARAAAALGAARCGFAPHPVAVADPLPPLRREVARIGVFFGDGWVDAAALSWLHDAVWRRPELAAARGAVEVVVGGAVGGAGDLPKACPDFRFVGPVDRALPFFAAVDVVAAPHRAPGAARTVVEALGHARPLLATPAAIAGLFSLAAPACLLAEAAEDFAAALALLVGSAVERRRLVDAGLAVAVGALSPEACFRPVIEAAAGLRPPPAQAGAGEPAAEMSLPQALSQGLAHQRAGRLHQAEQVFSRILSSAPDHPETLHALGTLLIQKGDTAAAVPVLRRATDRRPGNAVSWNNLATALNALARHAEAEEAAERALALREGYVEALLNRARARRGLGRAEAALADCAAALVLRPEAPELLHERGLVFGKLGDAAAAERDLKAAVAHRPGESGWNADLARLLSARRAAGLPRPRVALCCAGGGLPPDWEPVWALPGVEAVAVSAAAALSERCDLLITDDAALARRAAAARRAVWLRGAGAGDSERIRAFAETRDGGWAVADIAAHLAVWARAWALPPAS
ncbi:tetratricopeptide repeat protein [Oleispirillum naphthae]|uniref:tetratricopeptide repeat protein n=1 Tax=Oleispirillum naphthae TaxID=2838853 RepID=UPI0030823C07